MTRDPATLCFTGHRSYVPSPDDEARLAAALRAACDEGYRTFISGMAPGFDLAAAEAVVRLREAAEAGATTTPETGTGIKLIAAIPFRSQPHGYTDDDRRRYDALLEAADEVRVLAERYARGCYYRRDDWMVDRSARIICWYDGGNGHGGSYRAPKASSGTRYTLRRALAAGLEVVNIFRADGTLF